MYRSRCLEAICLLTFVIPSTVVSELSDAVAYIDHIFIYPLDDYLFTSSNLQVTEYSQKKLPDWLFLDENARAIKGVASDKDRGTFIGDINANLFAVTVDYYKLYEVAELSNIQHESQTCIDKKSVTEVKVVIGCDSNELTSKEKFNLIENLADVIKLKPNHISIKSNTQHQSSLSEEDVFSSSVLTGGGKLDADSETTSRSYLSWIVGCGNVRAHQMQVLEQLEAVIEDASLPHILGYDILGWQVLLRKVPENAAGAGKKRRLRRQVRTTSTPVPAVTDAPDVTEKPMVTPTVTATEFTMPRTTIKESASSPETTPSLTTKNTTPLTTVPTTTKPSTTMSNHPTTPITTPTLSISIPTVTVPAVKPVTSSPLSASLITTPTTPITDTPSKVKMVDSMKVSLGLEDNTTEQTTRTRRSTTPRAHIMTTFFIPPPSPPPQPPTRIPKLDIGDITNAETTPAVEEIDSSVGLSADSGVSVQTSYVISTTFRMPSLPPPITPPPPSSNKAPKTNQTDPYVMTMFSGQLVEIDIPQNLFIDPEGDAVRYALQEFASGRDVNVIDTWMMLIGAKIVALPRDKDIGINKYQLKATDSRGLSGSLSVTIKVLPKQLDTITQFYLMTLDKAVEPTDKTVLALMYKVTQKVQEWSPEQLQVDAVSQKYKPDGIYHIIKFGRKSSSEPNTCPDTENRRVLDELRSKLTLQTVDLSHWQLYDSYLITSIRSEPVEPCKNTRPYLNRDNSVLQAMDSQTTVSLGELYELTIPQTLFLDEEDIDIDGMTLELSGGGLERNSDTWLKVVDNRIVGLLWDVETPTKYQYTLIVTDAGGQQAEYDIEVTVVAPIHQPTNDFSITISSVYSDFADNLDKQLDVYRKLETALGNNAVVRFDSVNSGSVVIDFSVRNQRMPEKELTCSNVRMFRDQVFSQSDESISSQLLDEMSPYAVTKLSFVPLEPCVGIVEPMSAEIKVATTDGNKVEQESNILQIVIPTVVGMVLLIIIIAIVLTCVNRHRKQKSMLVSESNGTYSIEKGVPVVFEEELRDGNHTTGRREAQEQDPLMEDSIKPEPPAYPPNLKYETIPLHAKAGSENYQLPTPPTSEHE